VIALTATAVTFFFGGVFRISASGRLRHWSSASSIKEASRSKLIFFVKLFVFVMGGIFQATKLEQFVQLRDAIPEAGGYGTALGEALMAAKVSFDDVVDKR
ncbi:unnamed protein product, partial [Polarella glacialis]